MSDVCYITIIGIVYTILTLGIERNLLHLDARMGT